MLDTRPKPYVFVLMPFDSEFDDVYKLGIKPACETAGAFAERVDEQVFQESILQRIYNQIAKADIIVADMSGRNPNVFYETGYAHALGKVVILLTKVAEDIPFDLKHYTHIIYGGRIADLRAELEKRVRYIIEHPSSAHSSTINTLEVRINDVPLNGRPIVPFKTSASLATLATLRMRINIHNSVRREISLVDYMVGLLLPREFDAYSNVDRLYNIELVIIEDDKTLLTVRNSFQTLPGAWESIEIEPAATFFGPGPQFEVVVRLFTVYGYYDYPFIAEIQK